MRRLPGAAVAGLVAGTLAVSLVPSLTSNVDDMDVLIYAAAAARAHAEGALPYVAAWVEKGPLAMGWYQALEVVAGPYPLWAIALSVLLFHAVAAGAVYAAARSLGGEWAALPAALLYAVAAGSVGGTLNTEVPAAAMAALAWWAWLRPGGARAAFACGLLAAAAALCRQNAGILWPAMLAGELLRRRPDSGRRALAITGGFLLPVLLLLLVYAVAGALEILVFCVYGYNASIYVAATKVTAARLAAIPLDLWRSFFALAPTLSVSGLLGFAWILSRWRREAPERLATALAAVALTASLILGLRWFGHYFVLAMPFWALLGGVTVAELLRPERRPALRIAVALAVVAGLTWEVSLRQPRKGAARAARLVREPARLTDPPAWPGADRLCAAVARFMRERAAPGDRLFVWGMRPHLYVMSGLLPATRFVIGTFLTGLVPWEAVGSEEDTRRWIVPGSRALLMEDLRAQPPRFIVDASHDHLFAEGAYALDTFPELASFVRERYARVLDEGTGDRMGVWERVD
jgi:4-amino-4-deoxy-L-arabinose transferase-like glycosyltransferase